MIQLQHQQEEFISVDVLINILLEKNKERVFLLLLTASVQATVGPRPLPSRPPIGNLDLCPPGFHRQDVIHQLFHS